MYEPDLCLYHADCDDGFAAAWAIHKRWPNCQFAPAHYQRPLPVHFGPMGYRHKQYPPGYDGLNVLMVDFSAPADMLKQLDAQSVIVLDHHKSAAAALAEIPEIGAEFGAPIMKRFDMEKCGARLAWEFAFGDEAPAPLLIDYIEDRDLWRKQLPKSEEFTAALRSYPHDFAVWDQLFPMDEGAIAQQDRIMRMAIEGEAILRAYRRTIDGLVGSVYMGSIGNVPAVPMVNCPRHYSSDVCEQLRAEFPQSSFVATWQCNSDGFEFSLRSAVGGVDVSEIAKLYGGGGHAAAAGFSIKRHGPNGPFHYDGPLVTM